MSGSSLTPEQLDALFDILTHHETYNELRELNDPLAWPRFGFPMSGAKPGSAAAAQSSMAQLSLQQNEGASAPLLQTLLVQYVLPMPGIREFPPEWWQEYALGIVSRLAQADLSETYDKGGIGLRKTLTTASSSFLEMVARTSFSGLPRDPDARPGEFRGNEAADLIRTSRDQLHGLVYGDDVDEVFDHFTKTADLDSIRPNTPALTDYIVMHLAGLIHQVVVRSPEGPYLVKQLETVHGMIPWTLVKQTLRIGNAASMINGLLKILLAKISVANVIGRSKNGEDGGTNLLQKIISFVLSGDASDFRKAATKIEKAKERPNDQDLRIIRQHVAAGREAHKAAREASIRNEQSIVLAILHLDDPNRPPSLTEATHAQCLEYYSALLAVRDREAISAALCRDSQDHLSQAIRVAVGAYEPSIRMVHEKVNLKSHLDALEDFLDALIKVSKGGKKGGTPTIEDYVKLLHTHRLALYRFFHDVASSAPEVWQWWREWANASVLNFRQPDNAGSDVLGRLQQLFASLDPSVRGPVADAIDAHAVYLKTLEQLSESRLQAIIDGKGSPGQDRGAPGVYLARWQDLIDQTAITPAQPRGPVRRGRDVKNTTTRSKAAGSSCVPDTGLPVVPDVSVVVRALGDDFGRLARERATALQAHVELP